MQTFLTNIGWNKSLANLDDKRLGKQRVEAKQIVMVLAGESSGYQHHPAIDMWRGYERALCLYGAAACYQWRIIRKFNCEIYSWFSARETWFRAEGHGTELPPWLQDPWLMRSHRSNLIRKDPVEYAPKFPNTPENMPYLWPVNDWRETKGYRLLVSMADYQRMVKGERQLPSDLKFNEINRNVEVA
jgi:hypothetical protein